MAPWDWVQQQGEKIGNIGSNIDIPSALGPLAEIPQSIGERVGRVGSNTLGAWGESIGSTASNTLPVHWAENASKAGSNIDIPKTVQAAAGQPAAAAQAQTSPPGAAPDVQFQYAVNPLAASMFYASTIAPLLQQMDERYMGQMDKMTGSANSNLARFQTPGQFGQLFAQGRSTQAADQLGLHTALQAAAAQQPGYDALIKRLGEQQTATQNILQQQMAQKALQQVQAAGGDPNALAGLNLNI